MNRQSGNPFSSFGLGLRANLMILPNGDLQEFGKALKGLWASHNCNKDCGVLGLGLIFSESV